MTIKDIQAQFDKAIQAFHASLSTPIKVKVEAYRTEHPDVSKAQANRIVRTIHADKDKAAHAALVALVESGEAHVNVKAFKHTAHASFRSAKVLAEQIRKANERGKVKAQAKAESRSVSGHIAYLLKKQLG